LHLNTACQIKYQLIQISLPQLVKELAPYLLGWHGYFGFCQTPRVLWNLEAWIRRRLRLYLCRQLQNGPNRFKELRRRGVPKFNAAVAAGSPTGFWRMSAHPAVQQALRNPSFDALGLPDSMFLPQRVDDEVALKAATHRPSL
jgi:RNA-directed DNA polymerase